MYVSSEKSLLSSQIPFVKSFMWIKKNKEPNTEPCDTTENTDAHDKYWQSVH